MEVQAGWVHHALSALTLLVDALEQILTAEAGLDAMVRQEARVAAAPGTSFVRRDYELLLEGSERPRQRKLGWWDRFQTADGLVPDLARSIVALFIVGSVIWAGTSLDFKPFDPAPMGANPAAETYFTSGLQKYREGNYQDGCNDWRKAESLGVNEAKTLVDEMC